MLISTRGGGWVASAVAAALAAASVALLLFTQATCLSAPPWTRPVAKVLDLLHQDALNLETEAGSGADGMGGSRCC